MARPRFVFLLSPPLLAACIGCASPPPPGPGATTADLLHRLGRPTAEFAEAGGARRLEYVAGPAGKTTWIVELDAQGTVRRAEQVLDEAHFALILPGITQDELRRRLGPPARVWGVRYHDQTVWSYRYETPFCQLFHVGITPQGVVEDTSYGPDPRCDRDERFMGMRHGSPH